MRSVVFNDPIMLLSLAASYKFAVSTRTVLASTVGGAFPGFHTFLIRSYPTCFNAIAPDVDPCPNLTFVMLMIGFTPAVAALSFESIFFCSDKDRKAFVIAAKRWAE